MLIVFVILFFYAILAVLPQDHLRTSRMIGAIPVAIIMLFAFGLLAITVDGRVGLRHFWDELKETALSLPDMLKDLWRQLRS